MNIVKFVVSSISLIAASSPTDEVAGTLEAEIPGSLDWFVEWAKEESLLDRYIAAVHGRIPLATNVPRITAIHAAYLLYYENPELPIQEFESILRRGIAENRIESSQSNANKLSGVLDFMTTVPESLFVVLAAGHTWHGSNPQRIAQDTREAFAVTPNALGQSEYFHLVRNEKQLVRFIRAWLIFCIESLNTSPTCHKDGEAWRLSPEAKKGLFRRIALQMTYQRAIVSG